MSREPLTVREKDLWWELVAAAGVLVAFLLLNWLRPTHGGWYAMLLPFTWLLPLYSSLARMYTGETEVQDERQRTIDWRGNSAGQKLLWFAVVMLVMYRPENVTRLLTALFLAVVGIQIFVAALKLRLYAGHDAFWPERRLARRRAKRWRRLAERASNDEARAEWLRVADEIEAKVRR